MVVRSFPHMTAKEFARVAERLGPCELVNGEVVPMSPGGFQHSLVTGHVAGRLYIWVARKRVGRVLTNEAGLIVREAPDTVRGADVAYISYKRLPRAKTWTGFLRHPPELIVEVLGDDASWEDIETKTAEYHRFGVDLVWVVDPHTHTVRLYPKRGKGSVVHDGGEVRGGRLLPGFRCKVAEFFRP